MTVLSFVQILLRPFLNYFNFTGRSSRVEYLLFWLVRHVTFVCLNLFLPQFSIPQNDWRISLLASLLSLPLNWTAFIIGGFFIAPTMAIYARRLHDINLSGFWLIVIAAPVFCARIFTSYAVLIVGVFMREADDQTILGILALYVAPVFILESMIFLAFVLIPPSRGTNKHDPIAQAIAQG